MSTSSDGGGDSSGEESDACAASFLDWIVHLCALPHLCTVASEFIVFRVLANVWWSPIQIPSCIQLGLILLLLIFWLQ